MSGEDREPFLEPTTPRWRRRPSLICLGLLLVGGIALFTAVLLSYLCYWDQQEKDYPSIKVLTLNTWGMPASFGSYDKALRMEAIGDFINQSTHDIYLLEELWMRPDHNVIRQKIPDGWFMTHVADFSNGDCDGEIGPDGCSGLAVVSKYPFIEKSFNVYKWKGKIWDGEGLASKGIGRVRIEPFEDYIVDVFLTHTCASDGNSWYRQKQVKQLVETIKKSDADFVILGGDFNADPVVNKNETTLDDINNLMVSSINEFFQQMKNWLIAKKATYGNPSNSYSYTYRPVHYDYIFHKANSNNTMWTHWFDIPLFKTRKDSKQEVSFSDHEAVTAQLYLKKPDNKDTSL